jgi:hypothetical protein
MNEKIKIYQIFYDDESRSKLDSGFLPMDNSCNPESDWFEFSPIRNYLASNTLDEDTFYGFLSPNFYSKSNFLSNYVIDLINTYGNKIDVALFSIRWDQLAFFANPFEQGECAHPGIIKITQKFLDSINFDLNLTDLITHSQSSVFSNYVIAKPIYWKCWLDLGNKFYHYAKDNSEVNQATIHRGITNIALKVFIQERLSSIVLSQNKFRVMTPDQGMDGPITPTYFNNDIHTRRRLITCDLLKERFCNSGDQKFLEIFYKLRKEIKLNTDTQFGKVAHRLINAENSLPYSK